jgi:hypothetical protein
MLLRLNLNPGYPGAIATQSQQATTKKRGFPRLGLG